MAENYVLLETIELTQSAASVVFDNIPQSGYTDLKIVVSARVSSAGETSPPIQRLELLFNGVNTGGKYSVKMLYGNGSSAASVGGANANRDFYSGAATASGATANTFSNIEYYIPNYTSSAYKSFSIDSVTENNSTGADASLIAGLFADTTSVSSLTLKPYDLSNFVQYSTFSLYGLAAVGTTPVIAPLATGGNIVANDGTYWYHAFLSSGTFTPQTALTCDALVVAGGGGSINAGSGAGPDGGGGAGGLLAFTNQSLTATNYTVTVGAGGANTTGNDSQFGSLTLVKGGGYGANTDFQGGTGGSGGGSGGRFTSAGGAATSGQGNAGGVGFPQGSLAAGGGGGAGQPGNTSGRNGGNGINTYSSWASVTNTGANSGYFAGGGGGQGWYGGGAASGGLGGGGTSAAGTDGTGVAGTANTGGGGGGGNLGSTGGSGIVIIRYAMV